MESNKYFGVVVLVIIFVITVTINGHFWVMKVYVCKSVMYIHIFHINNWAESFRLASLVNSRFNFQTSQVGSSSSSLGLTHQTMIQFDLFYSSFWAELFYNEFDLSQFDPRVFLSGLECEQARQKANKPRTELIKGFQETYFLLFFSFPFFLEKPVWNISLKHQTL